MVFLNQQLTEYSTSDTEMVDRWILVGSAHFAVTAIVLKILGFILPSSITCYYSCVGNFVLFLYVAKITFEFTKKNYLTGKLPPENRAVFITGCDSGFGHYLARRLDSIGYPVFAGCLKPEEAGADELRKNCSERLQVLEIDVRSDGSVKKAVDFVKKNLGTSELWAIVNNAGIHKGLDVELTSIDDFKAVFDVNTLGPIRVTKAFLPMLRQSRGRVVTVASLAGRFHIPHITAYTMSKSATAAFSDCLKQEMDVWGVRVISIEPEAFRTPILNADVAVIQAEDVFSKNEPDIKDDYGEKYLKGLQNSFIHYSKTSSRSIEAVINDMESAISLEYPNARYVPSRNFFYHLICYFLERAPHWLTDYLIKLWKINAGYQTPKEARNSI